LKKTRKIGAKIKAFWALFFTGGTGFPGVKTEIIRKRPFDQPKGIQRRFFK